MILSICLHHNTPRRLRLGGNVIHLPFSLQGVPCRHGPYIAGRTAIRFILSVLNLVNINSSSTIVEVSPAGSRRNALYFHRIRPKAPARWSRGWVSAGRLRCVHNFLQSGAGLPRPEAYHLAAAGARAASASAPIPEARLGNITTRKSPVSVRLTEICTGCACAHSGSASAMARHWS